MILSDNELLRINGGAISAALIREIADGISMIIDLGRLLGSAIKRIVSNNQCAI